MPDRYLVISDVDGTLLGDPRELESLRQWTAAHRAHLDWVYSSGRFCHSLRQSVQVEKIPVPVALIGGVGTEVCVGPSDVPLECWNARLGAGFSAARIRETLKAFHRLTLQPEEFQSDLKVSYFLHHARAEELAELELSLRNCGFDIQLVYSSQRDLDVLPRFANKGNAARFIAQHLGYRPMSVIVAGDSANDLAMFQVGFRGVVVNNAHAELKALASDSVFVARRNYAGGVLEGLEHWIGRDRDPKSSSTNFCTNEPLWRSPR